MFPLRPMAFASFSIRQRLPQVINRFRDRSFHQSASCSTKPIEEVSNLKENPRKEEIPKARPSRLEELRVVNTAVKLDKPVFKESAPGFTPPTPDGEPESFAPKIVRLVDDIAGLTLLEVADLNKALKKKLNLPDTPMVSAGMVLPGAAPAKKEEDDSAPAVAATKTKFSVKLTKIDDSKKIAVIKEVKSIVPSLNLVQAKKFVESLPQTVKGDILKDEAEKIVAQLSALGAVCEID